MSIFFNFGHDDDFEEKPEPPCDHESDGKMYGAMEWGAAPIFLCKKCHLFFDKKQKATWENVLTTEPGTTITFSDHTKITMDIICHGFSVKDTILDVLDKYNNGYRMDLPTDELNNLAQELTDALAIKCRLKQGES